jgi:uncharacterized protein YcbK (DUF882 family)
MDDLQLNFFTSKELRIDNIADKDVRRAAFTLRDRVLNPLRMHYGVPVVVISAYRPEGSKPTSHHLYKNGYAAADIKVKDVDPQDVFDKVYSTFKYAELILYRKDGFVHMSINEDRERCTGFTSIIELDGSKTIIHRFRRY